MSFIRDYIAYAKLNCNPVLTDEASQSLIEKYVSMRRVGKNNHFKSKSFFKVIFSQSGSGRGQVSAYPRQLESLIRLSEALARIRLSDTVEINDVEEAYRY